MSLTDSCGIPAGLLRLLRCLKEDITEPISWNLQKSKQGCFSLKFWTHSFRAENGTKNNTQLRERAGQPRAATPVTEGCKSTIEDLCPPSQDSSRLSGTSPRTLNPPKSVGSRKRKSPSRRKRNRQRQAVWRLKKKASYIKLQAAAKRQAEISSTWKPHGHDTGSVIVGTDTSSPPEPASSGPVLTQALEKSEIQTPPEPHGSGPELLSDPNQVLESSRSQDSVEGVFQKPAVAASQSVSEIFNSLIVAEQNTPESSISDSSDAHLSLLDSDDDADNENPTTTSKWKPPVPELCVNCGSSEGRLLSCSACKAVKYCSVACQRSNWDQHKLACADLKRIFH